MSDSIDILPVDELPVKDQDQKILDILLKKTNGTGQKLVHGIKIPIVAGIVFMLLSMPQLSEFIQSVVPYTKSSSVGLLIVKSVVFTFVLFIYVNCSIKLG